MAVTVTTDQTILYDGNTVFGGGTVYTGFQRFGSGCNGGQVSNATGHFTGTVASFSLVGRQIFSWMIGPGSIGTLAQGGYRIVIGDGTNTRAYYVGGNDRNGFFVRGWFCFTLHGDNLPAQFAQLAGAAQPNLAALTLVGVGFTTVAKANGNSPNVFWDIARVGTGITVVGNPATPGKFSEIAAIDELTTTAYGVFRTIDDGVFGAQGRLTFGSTTAASNFEETDAVMFFEGNTVSTNFYELRTIGSASHANIFKLGNKLGTGEAAVGANGVTIQSGRSFIADFTSVNVNHQIYGSTVRGATRGVNFGTNANNEVISTIFDQCGQVNLANAFTRNSTFSGTRSTVGALLWNAAINIQNSTFNGNEAGIEYPAAGTFNHFNLSFAGNTHDIRFTGSGDLVINALGTSNTSSFVITGSGTSVTIENTVSLSFSGLQPNTEVRIYNADTMAELAGIENTSGTFTYTYSFSTTTILYVIFNLSYLPVTGTILLPANDTTLPITQVFDRVYSNPD